MNSSVVIAEIVFLVVAPHAFGASHIFHGYTIAFAAFQIFVNPLEFVVEGIVHEIHFPGAMAFYAPAHGKLLHLPDAMHLRDITMAIGTFQLSHTNMLGVVEICMVGKVVDFDPSDRLTDFQCLVNLADLFRS